MNLLATNFKQKNDWTCGPAVARIVCHYYGVEKEISHLVAELNTTKEGTSNRDLMRVLRRHGINSRVREHTSIKHLKQTLKNNIVVVAYWIPRHKEAHYSILTKIGRTRVYFHDTWYGSTHSYTINYFEKNWWDGEATRWMLAVPLR
jgi:predicted double-glycine peptidase